jgi:hypothetical protein
MMKITIVGWILIIAVVIAALIILDPSAANPSLAHWLSNIRESFKCSGLPGPGSDTPPEQDTPGTAV